ADQFRRRLVVAGPDEANQLAVALGVDELLHSRDSKPGRRPPPATSRRRDRAGTGVPLLLVPVGTSKTSGGFLSFPGIVQLLARVPPMAPRGGTEANEGTDRGPIPRGRAGRPGAGGCRGRLCSGTDGGRAGGGGPLDGRGG